MGEANGASVARTGSLDARKWARIAEWAGSPALGTLAGPGPLWGDALEALGLVDGVSQTLGDVRRGLGQRLSTELGEK